MPENILNRKARYDYEILETIEAGLVLRGTEVKSIRQGKVNLKDSFAISKNGEIVVYNMHISPYDHGNRYNLEATRPRKLVLHKSQIRKLVSKKEEQELALVPLSLYFKDGRAKIQLALAKGKKQYDRREDIKKRDIDREMRGANKGRQKGAF